MSYQSPKDVASGPGLRNVTGIFCFPSMSSAPGRINVDTTLVRPLSITTGEVSITSNTNGFSILNNVGDVENWGINKGDYVVFCGTNCDGIYELSEVDFSLGGVSIALGISADVPEGFIYFLNKEQKILGSNGTKFKTKASVGDYLIINDPSSGYSTVQALKITRIESDEVLFVERGLVNISINDYPFLICNKNTNRGISLKISGSGVIVNETLVNDGDILTFYDENGLAPIFGDAGLRNIQVLIQQ